MLLCFGEKKYFEIVRRIINNIVIGNISLEVKGKELDGRNRIYLHDMIFFLG